MNGPRCSDTATAMTDNRRFGVQRDGRWLLYVGDCGAAAHFLASRPAGSGWGILMFLDAFLRSFGQLVLANNPVSGAVVLVALCAARPWAGLAAVCCCSVAILVAAAAGQQRGAVSSGLASCNAALLGAATGCMGLLDDHPFAGRVWTLLLFGSVVCVYVTSALSTLVSAVLPPAWWGRHAEPDEFLRPVPGKAPWPPLFALPFGLLQLLLLLCLAHSGGRGLDGDLALALNATTTESADVVVSPTLLPGGNETVTRIKQFYDIDHLDWGQMFQGVLLSASRVMALEDAAVSASILVALLVYSPIAAVTAVMGAFVGSLAGVVLTEPPYASVYRGLWGVNGLLSLWAIAAHSFVLSWHSAAAGLGCASLSAALQAAAAPLLQQAGLPCLLLPHSLAALLFLLVASSARTGFVRPAVLSFPEKHKYDFWREQSRQLDEKGSHSGEDGD